MERPIVCTPEYSSRRRRGKREGGRWETVSTRGGQGNLRKKRRRRNKKRNEKEEEEEVGENQEQEV